VIEWLHGVVVSRVGGCLVLDVNGVGYGLEVPLPVFSDPSFQVQKPASFWVHTRVREDALKLYGFLKLEEKQMFEVLLQINGVGPKLALALLSSLDLVQMKNAVIHRDESLFLSVPGVGKKTAEKISLELRNRLNRFPEAVSSASATSGMLFAQDVSTHKTEFYARNREDLYSALTNLGYKEKEVISMLNRLDQKSLESQDFGTLMQQLLSYIRNDQKHKKTLEVYD
jgi:Holliday junction DNA helicase RuvA